MTDRDRLIAALADARDQPDGDGKRVELERIAAHADAAGDVRLGFDARCALIDAYQHHSERWRLCEPVVWCLTAFDRDRTRFDDQDARRLRHYHRLAVAAFCGSARVGLSQTRSMLDDFERRLRAEGRCLAVVHRLRCLTADQLGDEPTARRWLDRWQAAGDGPDDCPACGAAQRARLLAGWGAWQEAVHAAEPVLDDPVSCTEQPEGLLAALLLPYLRLGRVAEAGHAHVRAYHRHRRQRDAFPQLAAHLRFCALAGHHARGLDILAEQLPRLDQPHDELSAMEFAAAGALVCRLADAAGLGRRVIGRPGHGERPAAEPTVSALGAELLATAQDLASRFDARNGTGHQAGRVGSWLAERPLPGPVDQLPTDAGGSADPLDGDSSAGEDGSIDVPASEPDDLPVPLRLAAITAVLDQRGDIYTVGADDTVSGRWGDATIQFERAGTRGEILHARVIAERRLPAGRLADAYEFCNAWNHDRLLPKAYVHDTGAGELILAGDVTTDLGHGVAAVQLAILIQAALATGAAYAAAVADLP